jgi:hypothetical protein
MNVQFPIPKFVATAVLLLGLFMIWPESQDAKISPAPAKAFAGVGVANEKSETLFTASADGKTIYMWQYFSSKPPKFLGQSEAILLEAK